MLHNICFSSMKWYNVRSILWGNYMSDYFDIDNLNKNSYCVGKLNQSVINLLGLNIKSVDIIFSKDKIEYTHKHEQDFANYQEYKRLTELTPDIIANPDYVAIHPNGNSLEYIKVIDEIMIVAVRIKPQGVLWVKSVYPISEAKFAIYQSWGTLKKC